NRNPVAGGPGPGGPAGPAGPADPGARPATSTPPSASAQDTAALRPSAATPSRLPSLVSTPPARMARRGYQPPAARVSPVLAGRPASASVCSQSSQARKAASAAPSTRASGSWRGSQDPAPANAVPRCSRRLGSAGTPARYAATCRGPASSPETAAAG